MSAAVHINGVAYSADKGFYSGTQRTVPPEQTLEKIRAAAPTVGLTRLADVTGLDRIGIPTVVGYRPNAPTLTTSGGKGFTTLAALVSAGMEAVEIWHAENLRLDVIIESHAALSAVGPTLPAHQLPLTRHALFDRRSPRALGDGLGPDDPERGRRPVRDRQHGQHHPLPDPALDAVRRRLERARRRQPHPGGARGGAVRGRRTRRDRLCSRIADGGLTQRVDLDTVTDPLVRSLDRALRRRRASPRTCSTARSTPEMPDLHRRWSRTAAIPAMGLYRGYGAHLDPSIAMIRALTEAAQARLLLIAGARDDYFTRDQRMNRFMGDGRRASASTIIPAIASADRSRLRAPPPPSEPTSMIVLDRLQRRRAWRRPSSSTSPTPSCRSRWSASWCPGSRDTCSTTTGPGPALSPTLKRRGQCRAPWRRSRDDVDPGSRRRPARATAPTPSEPSSPEQTLDRVRGRFAAIGLTRLANITGSGRCSASRSCCRSARRPATSPSTAARDSR